MSKRGSPPEDGMPGQDQRSTEQPAYNQVATTPETARADVGAGSPRPRAEIEEAMRSAGAPGEPFRAGLVKLHGVTEESLTAPFDSLRVEWQQLNDDELRILQSSELSASERLEIAEQIREHQKKLQERIGEVERATLKQLAELKAAVASLPSQDEVGKLRQELRQQQEVVARLPASRAMALLPTLLALLLITAVGVAGMLLPRQEGNDLWVSLAGENLLADGSFEEGTWQAAPGDCCSGAPGLASLGLTRVTDATEGRYALQLTSENHCACVSTSAREIEPGEIYLLSFDYKAVEGESPPQFSVVQATPSGAVDGPAGHLDSSARWQQHQAVFAIAPEATGLSIYLYANSDGNAKTVTRYDNVRLARLAAD